MDSNTIGTYLRCDHNHPNRVTLRERDLAIGRACAVCGQPLRAPPPREFGPRRTFGPRP